MGLPGSGKTYLAARLQPLLKAAWYNADNVREMANDWDFSEEGRKRQAKRMANFAIKLKEEGAKRCIKLKVSTASHCSLMNESALKFQKELDRIASLTLRELELFRLLSLGKTVSYCAEVMNLNEKTVYNRQTKIREKLQVDTQAGLVHLAQRHQIIDSNVRI